MISTRGRICRTIAYQNAVPFTAVDMAHRLDLRATQVVGVINNMMSRGELVVHQKRPEKCKGGGLTTYYVRKTNTVLMLRPHPGPWYAVNEWRR